MSTFVNISELVGKTFDTVELADDKEQIVFKGAESFRMYHPQDCCEHVRVEDVVGNLNDLVGSPILKAEEATSEELQDGKPEYPESFKWTFYTLATVKGYVTIRWLGESNGYYSESVDVVRL